MSDPAARVRALHSVARPRIVERTVRFELTRPDLDSDTYTTRLHGVPLDAAAPGPIRRLSSGWSDRAWTRVGGTTALLRAEAGGPAQLWAAPEDGEPRAVTDLPLGVEEFVLAADGTAAYAVARDPEPGRYGTDPDVPPAAEAPRRITTAAYRADGLGYTLDRPARLVRVPLDGEDDLGPAGEIPLPDPTEALRLPGDVRAPLAEHGRVSALGPATAPGTVPDLRTTVWLVGEDEPAALRLGSLSVQAHAWLDHDRLVLLAADLGPDGTDFVARIAGLHLHDLRSGETTRLTPEDEHQLGGELRVLDGDALCLETHDGAERLVRIAVPADGEAATGPATVTPLTPGDWVVSHADIADCGTIVVTAATPDSSGEVFRLAPDGPPVPLTALDAQRWAPLEPLRAETSGGTVHGWCALPEGDGPYPVVVLIHGGPFAQYTAAAFDEVQVLVDAGIAVVLSNPRGSAGRGRSWGLAVQGDFAAPAAEDVLAVLDAALAAHPALDRRRVGVWGGSYGGYLTAMLTTEHHSFAGAIVERGFLDPVAFAGTSDIGMHFGHAYVGTDPAEIARQSPLARVGDVRTPTLVIHSEQDLRCPIDQAQQYYAGLLRHGTTAEMLLFPGEGHELSRSGRPRHRVARFDAMLDWWQRCFEGTGHPATDPAR